VTPSARLRTVLVFAYECAPHHRHESTAGAQRPAQFAKHLPEFGWRAIVLCSEARARGTGWTEEHAGRVRDTLRGAVGDESVVVPLPSMPSDGRIDRWWRTAAGAHARTNGRTTTRRKVLTAVKFLTGDYSQSWQPCAAIAASIVQSLVPVDACIGEHSPDAGLFCARRFAARYGVPWIADFRDPILQPLRPAARALYRPVARRLVRTAAATVNVNDAWTALDRRLFGRPAVSIPNGFDPDDFAAVPDAAAVDRFEIAYTGSIKREQRLETFLRGLARAREDDRARFSDVSFVYRGVAAAHVQALARTTGVADLVDPGGVLARPESLSVLRRAALLLVLSAGHPGDRDPYFGHGFYPAKVFEYFGARRPILCVPGDGGLLDDLIGRTRTGTTARDEEAVANLLIQAVTRWRAGEPPAYAPDALEVSRYTRRNLAGELAGLLDRIVTT
jgi:glycosyltransferase involved in cell wall biosynthesis